MKKTYEIAELQCVELADEDILTSSTEMQKKGAFDTPYDAF